jgi:hexokinase
MPLLGNDTDGAVTRKRIEAFAAKTEKVTVVAATDAATTQAQATLAAAGHVIYTMTPTAGRALTTPTGAELGAAFTDEAVGTSFKFSVVNLAGSNSCNYPYGWRFWCHACGCRSSSSSLIGFVCRCVHSSRHGNYLPSLIIHNGLGGAETPPNHIFLGVDYAS